MKGLLIKDIRLMMGQKFYYIVVAAMMIALLCASVDPMFVVTYLSILCMMFVISSCNYDEFDNGYAFLFTLPIRRKEYAREKYIFGVILGGCSWVLVVIILGIYQLVMGGIGQLKDILLPAMMIILAFQIILAILLPIQLKYGSEKGKMLQLMVYGVIFAVAFLGLKVLKRFNVNIDAIFDKATNIDAGVFLAVACIVTVVIIGISLRISENIMERKEF